MKTFKQLPFIEYERVYRQIELASVAADLYRRGGLLFRSIQNVKIH